jgi:hypothetical protein
MKLNTRQCTWVLVLLGATQATLAAAAPGVVNTDPASLPPVFVSPPRSDVQPPKQPGPIIELTTLKVLLAKGVITQAEYDGAVKDLADSAGARAGESPTVAVAGWTSTLYGFAQMDFVWNSTQSFEDATGNGQVARPDTYAGAHSRFVGTIRNSRFGFRLAAPAWGAIKASGNLEFDLGGGVGAGAIASAGSRLSEGAFFTNPVLRVRHAYGKIETPIVDVLFGQTWALFGWLPSYVPTIVQWPGVPGELFARTPQIRISRTFKTEYVHVDAAVAALRPPQRDAAVPEGQAGLRISFPKWTSWHTGHITGTSLTPASLGVSGTVRQLGVGAPCTPAEGATSCESASTRFVTGMGLAINAYLPVIPAKAHDKSNSLSLVGEFVTGTSINDLYSGLTGGVGSALPAGTHFSGHLDSGLAGYDAAGKLVQPNWLTSFVGLEYYLPGGRATLFVNWGHSQLNNAAEFSTPASALRNHSNLYEAGAFFDVTPEVRVGLDYARIVDVYQDGVTATNDSVQGSAFLFF